MISLLKILKELYSFGDREEPPYSRFDTARESQELEEGPNDPNIFKAIFMAGGPGSGKSFVAEKLGLQAKGLKTVNSDEAFEYLMKKRDLDLTMPASQTQARDVARLRAKELTKQRMQTYVDGRLGLVIDGTAKDANKIMKMKNRLEEIGYSTAMVFVNSSLNTALYRNKQRPRQVPDDILAASHSEAQLNKKAMQGVFADKFVEVHNERDTNNIDQSQKQINSILREPLSDKAKQWIQDQRKTKK